ncbi:MAG: tetratricopeptide repeat protein [Desulfobacter sp.]|nr:MAG: tetratricopeptide repeat protein [Desulfobacter sp.]
MTENKDTLYGRAVRHYQNKDYNAALELCETCIKNGQSGPDIFYLIGIIFKENNMYEKGAYYIHRALLFSPGNIDFHMQLGLIYQADGNLDEAMICYKKVILINPGHAEAYNCMGKIMQDKGDARNALECFQKAINASPDNYNAWFNAGVVLEAIGAAQQCETMFDRCITLKPDDAQAWNNLAIACQQQNKFEKAVDSYEKAIRLDPGYFAAYNNLATLYGDIGEEGKAVENLKKCINMAPENEDVLSNLVARLRYACDWSELERFGNLLDRKTDEALKNRRLPKEPPFSAITHHDDPARHLAIAQSYARSIEQDTLLSAKGRFSFENRCGRNRKIKLGYLSNDLRDHAVGHILAPLFERHNRKKFEVTAYTYGEGDGSSFTSSIEKGFDRFIDISGLNIYDSARQIHNDRIDILIDLKGYTRSNRMGVFALRPAPVQVSYLGYLGTSGAEFMDYIIADPVVIPKDQFVNYSEKVIHLDCYQVTTYDNYASGKNFRRKDLGLPEDGFIMCSFNQAYKYDPVMFNTWMEIMKQIPGSVLWMRELSQIAMENLKKEAGNTGVDPDRLIFAPRMELGDHLERLRLADIALDTLIYNSGATTSNALWASVPVVTLQGRQFVARMSSSSLTAIGIPEMITHSLNEYKARCIELATDRNKLKTIRQTLAENRDRSTLFNIKKFVNDLESGYLKIWEDYQKQQPKC